MLLQNIDKSLINYEEDWVYCKNCLFYALGDCDGPEDDSPGCYRGEELEDD
jgi:hypothetical protein